jgi:adenosylcobinamide kinase/adenosylcobinamide-phosphate guanylyltransferase
MEKRIKRHQGSRPAHWKTFEETDNLKPIIIKIGSKFDCIIIDCLTLLVSNLILSGNNQVKILKKAKELLCAAKKCKAAIIMVSNEVGLGIVPDNLLARNFRDIAGSVNQIVAREADEVIFTVSGLPLKIK